jgi:hypothetical protein
LAEKVKNPLPFNVFYDFSGAAALSCVLR